MRRDSKKYFDTVEESVFPAPLTIKKLVLAADALSPIEDSNLLKYIGAFSNIPSNQVADMGTYFDTKMDQRAKNLLGDIRNAKIFTIDAYNKKAATIAGGAFNLADKNVQRLSTLTALSAAYAANQIDLLISAAWKDGLNEADNKHRHSSETGSADFKSATRVVIPFTYIGLANATSIADHIIGIIDAAASRFSSKGRNSLTRDEIFTYTKHTSGKTVSYTFGNLPHVLVIELQGFDLNAVSSDVWPYNNSASEMMKNVNKPVSYGVPLLSWFAQTGYNPAPFLDPKGTLDATINGLYNLALETEYVVESLNINKYLSTIYYVDLTSYSTVYTRTIANLKSSYSAAILQVLDLGVTDFRDMLESGDIINADRFLMSFVNTVLPSDVELALDEFYMNCDSGEATAIYSPYYMVGQEEILPPPPPLGGDLQVKSTTSFERLIAPAGMPNSLAVQFHSLSRAERLLVFRCAELGITSSYGSSLKLIELRAVAGSIASKVFPTERLLAAGRTRGELSRSLFVARRVIQDVIMSSGLYGL